VVHKEYREDTQTVRTNDEGQYVVHVDTVVGTQDGDSKPTITNSQDEFIIPIVDSDIVYDEEWLNKMWQEMWENHGEDWNPWILFEDGPNYVDPIDGQIEDIPEWRLADWKLPPAQDEVDRILAEDENYKVPEWNGDYEGYQNWDGYDDWRPYQDYYDVMEWDDTTGEWTLNPAKFKEKYKVDPVIEELEFEDAVNRDIEAIEREQEMEEEANAVTADDIVWIDPETGKLKINEEAYYQMFGVYPSFEWEDEGKAQTEQEQVMEGDAAQKEQAEDPLRDQNASPWWMDLDRRDYRYPKDANQYWNEMRRRGNVYGRYPYSPPATMDSDWRTAAAVAA